MRIWGLLRRKNLLVTGDEWLVTGDGWLVMIWIYCWAKSNKKSSISPDNSIYDCEIEQKIIDFARL